MSPFALVATLMCLVALAGWANTMTLKLPHGVAMLLAGLMGALAVFALQWLLPQLALLDEIEQIVSGIDFAQTVTGYMLAFLLFAGAMQVDLGEFRKRWIAITTLATLGVGASIIIVGFGLYLIAQALGIALPLVWTLVFGALISPTDPVAVLATVRYVRLPKSLTAILQGEALFNDGVGIVAFTALVAVATGAGDTSASHAVFSVVVEAIGGLALGMAASWLVIRLMGTVDDFAVETSMSIALAMSVYAGAQALGLSGAIAAVGAGMLFGGQRAKKAMEGETAPYLKYFWTLVDEILNALLFLLLGVEMIAVPFYTHEIGLIAGAIPLVLLARFAVVLPWGAWYRSHHRERGATAILGWGGLHGALSLALALSLPRGDERTVLLAVTYAVVAFSIAIQGLSFGPMVRRLKNKNGKRDVMLKTLGIVSLTALMLAGCAVFGGANDKALRRTPSFRAGYSDGCAAATAQSANPRDDKNSLEGEDRTYKRGYAMGYQSCQQRSTAPVGAPTGGLSNPGHP